MATIRSLITSTLRRLNVVSANETPTAEDMDISQEALNSLIDSMSNIMQNIHTIAPYRFLLTANQYQYKLGPAFDDSGNPTGADWVVTRPMRIEAAVMMVYPAVSGSPPNQVIGATSGTLFRELTQYNYAQYASLTMRNIQSTWPTLVYDDGAYPCRTLSFWPVPQNAYAVELWLWEPLLDYSNLDQELNLPPGYERYLTLKLAVEVAPEFGKSISEGMLSNLQDAETSIRTLNNQSNKSAFTPAFKWMSGKYESWMGGNDAPNNSPRQS